MTQKSILELPEAQRRLQQMAADQTVFAELVAKLKQFVRDAEVKADTISARMVTVDAALGELTSASQASKEVLDQFQQHAADAFQEFERRAAKIGEQVTRTLAETERRGAQLEDQAKQFHSELRARQESALQENAKRHRQAAQDLSQSQSASLKKQEVAFAEFQTQYRNSLQDLTGAYERQKVIFDSVKLSTEELKSNLAEASEQIRGEMATLRSELTATFNDGLTRQSRRNRQRFWTLEIAILITAATAVYSAYRLVSGGSSGDPGNLLPAARLWTDKTGKYTVEAVLERSTAEGVQLRKLDGRVVEIPLDRLSTADQDYANRTKAAPPAK